MGDRGIEEWKVGESGEEIGMGRGGRKKSEEVGVVVLGVFKLGLEGGASWDGRFFIFVWWFGDNLVWFVRSCSFINSRVYFYFCVFVEFYFYNYFCFKCIR